MKTVQLKVKKVHDDAVIPKYQTDGSAAFDLHAIEEVFLVNFHTIKVRTGLAFDIPEGYELQIRPRSGLSLKNVSIPNSPATIDEDFTGEVCVIMRYMNISMFGGFDLFEGHTINKGDRIAQAVLCPVTKADIIEVDEINKQTQRGSGGFGSTGT